MGGTTGYSMVHERISEEEVELEMAREVGEGLNSVRGRRRYA